MPKKKTAKKKAAKKKTSAISASKKPRTKYKPEVIVEALNQSNGLISLAARRIGCDRMTIYNYRDRFPEVAQAITDQREQMTDVAELSLFNQVKNGEAWAVCFYLKTQGKNRGYVERQEFTGKDGKAISLEAFRRIIGEEE